MKKFEKAKIKETEHRALTVDEEELNNFLDKAIYMCELETEVKGFFVDHFELRCTLSPAIQNNFFLSPSTH